jgi:hypothetical protein
MGRTASPFENRAELNLISSKRSSLIAFILLATRSTLSHVTSLRVITLLVLGILLRATCNSDTPLPTTSLSAILTDIGVTAMIGPAPLLFVGSPGRVPWSWRSPWLRRGPSQSWTSAPACPRVSRPAPMRWPGESDVYKARPLLCEGGIPCGCWWKMTLNEVPIRIQNLHEVEDDLLW